MDIPESIYTYERCHQVRYRLFLALFLSLMILTLVLFLIEVIYFRSILTNQMFPNCFIATLICWLLKFIHTKINYSEKELDWVRKFKAYIQGQGNQRFEKLFENSARKTQNGESAQELGERKPAEGDDIISHIKELIRKWLE